VRRGPREILQHRVRIRSLPIIITADRFLLAIWKPLGPHPMGRVHKRAYLAPHEFPRTTESINQQYLASCPTIFLLVLPVHGGRLDVGETTREWMRVKERRESA